MKKGRILALDVGRKRIGVAVSDEWQWTAQPLTVIKRKDDEGVFKTIANLVEEQEVIKVVVGLPVTLRGEIGHAAKEVLGFVEELKKRLSMPIITWDEALTTAEAEEILLEADLSRKKRRQVIDKLAAALILESYLRATAGD